MTTLRISASVPWKEVVRYLYGRPSVLWDVTTDTPRILADDDLGQVYEVRWDHPNDDYARAVKERLASGLIVSRTGTYEGVRRATGR